MEIFLLSCWNDAEKPTVLQGKKWLNHVLTLMGRPNINNSHRLEYASVIDLLHGMRKEPRWKQYQVEGAEPLTKEMVKRILSATVFQDNGEFDAVRLRNKTIAGCMLGWEEPLRYTTRARLILLKMCRRKTTGALRWLARKSRV